MIQKVKDILNVILFADIHMTNYHDTPLQVPEKQKKTLRSEKMIFWLTIKRKAKRAW